MKLNPGNVLGISCYSILTREIGSCREMAARRGAGGGAQWFQTAKTRQK